MISFTDRISTSTPTQWLQDSLGRASATGSQWCLYFTAPDILISCARARRDHKCVILSRHLPLAYIVIATPSRLRMVRSEVALHQNIFPFVAASFPPWREGRLSSPRRDETRPRPLTDISNGPEQPWSASPPPDPVALTTFVRSFFLSSLTLLHFFS